MVIEIENEFMLKQWFEKNFEKLGYDSIVRKDIGIFPDFIMLKNGKEIKVELERISSNFTLHNHDIDKADEVVCITKEVDLGIPIVEIKGLKFVGLKSRISATIDEENADYVRSIVKQGNYRNMSHVIESAIIMLAKKEGLVNEIK